MGTYKERDDFVPNPLYITGVADTTGTGGDTVGNALDMSPVFARARADALAQAVKDVENDPAGNPASVNLPSVDDKSYDDALQELKDAAAAAQDSLQVTDGLTPGQAEAAEEGEPVNPNSPEAKGEVDNEDSAGGAGTIPAESTPVGNPNAVTSDETGTPAVNPNAKSRKAAADNA